MAIELPTQKIEPKSQNPSRLILFSPPKHGKTTAVAALDNCLLIDLESGSDFVSALKVKVNSLEELQELGTQERRAARYITDNTSNVQTARNSVANLAINAQLARNKLYGAKKDYQRQRYDLNRQERVNARNANSQIMYQDAINEYNKAVGLNQQLMAVRTQGLQGMLQGIEGLAGAVNNYASARLYEKLWPHGVTNHMRSGGLARRKRA